MEHAGSVVVQLLLLAALCAGMWKVFEKAGEPGWKALIPLYSMWVWMGIIDRPKWWLLGFLVPLLNLVVLVVMLSDTSKCFGKGVGYTVGLFFLPFIFFPLLGFGDATYRRRASEGGVQG